MTIVATDTALPSARPAEKPPSTRFNIAIGIVAGLSAYFALGFDRTFAPHKIGWLFCPADRDWYYDPATYFLGWNYFRHSAWHLPPGLNPHYGLEYGSAIVYSDSLAIFALLLKPFNSILPQTFQYLGIWILTCFLLQGIFGALLASLFLVQAIPKLLVAGFFVISPIMLERAWTEYTLMGQWLLLWGIYLYFRPRPERLRWTWIILAAIAPLTSFYMAPMVLMLWGADLLKGLFLQRRPIRWLTIEAIAVPSVVLLVMWLGGFFAIPVKNGQTYGFGGFAANLLGFIDPLNASIFLKSLPKSPLWHGEGFCYLGLGIIFLGVIAVHELIRSGIPRGSILGLLPLALVVLSLAVFSLSDKIAIGSHVIDFPWIPHWLGRTFRASGRMVWPFYYALWLAVFYLATHGLKPSRATIILALMLLIQITDLSEYLVLMRHSFIAKRNWINPLKDPFWEAAAHRYRRIVVVPSGGPLPYVPLAYFGSNHGMTTNAMYLGRFPEDKIGPASQRREKSLRDNDPNRATLYIVPNPYYFKEYVAKLSPQHGVGRINGYNVIAPYWFSNVPPVATEHLRPGGSKVDDLIQEIPTKWWLEPALQ